MDQETEEMSNLKKKLTGLALQIAGAMNVKLDFSHKSVENVESILARIHDEYKKTRDDDGLRGIAVEFAAYMISVMEQNGLKGTWKRDHPDMGPQTFPYEWGEQTLFIYGWCMKRIFDGPGDDVWIKYKTFVLSEIEKKKPGEKKTSSSNLFQDSFKGCHASCASRS